MNQRMSALASGPKEMVPACSVARASKRRLKKVLAPVVHLVAWKSFPKKLWNFLTRMDPVASTSMQKVLASSTLDGSMAMVSFKVSKTTPIQMMMVVGPSHLSGAASRPSWAIRSRRWW